LVRIFQRVLNIVKDEVNGYHQWMVCLIAIATLLLNASLFDDGDHCHLILQRVIFGFAGLCLKVNIALLRLCGEDVGGFSLLRDTEGNAVLRIGSFWRVVIVRFIVAI